MTPAEQMLGRAYSGEPEGAFSYESDGGILCLAILLRPDAPMGQLVAIPPVVALGVLDALEGLGTSREDIGIGWPHEVVRTHGNETLVSVSTKAGYAGGMFVVAALRAALKSAGEGVASALRDAVVERVASWAESSRSLEAKAGPWAPFLPEYFDRVALMGKPVNVCYPNGTVYARGYFVGIDVWGRATVRTKRGGDLEFPPERFRIEPQR